MSSQQLELQQVGKSENVTGILGGGVDLRYPHVPETAMALYPPCNEKPYPPATPAPGEGVLPAVGGLGGFPEKKT